MLAQAKNKINKGDYVKIYVDKSGATSAVSIPPEKIALFNRAHEGRRDESFMTREAIKLEESE